MFLFFEKPENLGLITPTWLHFEILTPSRISLAPGSLIDYRIRLIGILKEYPKRGITFGAVHFDGARLLKLGRLAGGIAAGMAPEGVGQIASGNIPRPGELLMNATEPVRHPGDYDFANTDLAGRMSDKVVAMRFQSGYWRIPSPDLLFPRRKLGGSSCCSRDSGYAYRFMMPFCHT